MSRDDEFEQTGNTQDDVKVKIDEILTDLDAYLRQLARKKLPHSIIHPDVDDLEADDLAQRALIKMWLVMQKEAITHYRAYAGRTVYNESIDMIRRHKRTSQLPLNDQGELDQGHILFASNEIVDDPAYVVEQQDIIMRYASNLVDNVLELPPQQRRAMICELKEEVEGLLPIIEAFLERGLDIGEINWSQDREVLHRQRVSLSIARKKMRAARRRNSPL